MSLEEPLPTKAFFRIGEVSKFVGVDPHVIRYWEGEFPGIKPITGKSRQRLFRREDVLMLRKIRHLLHVQRYTIDGARRLLESDNSATSPALQDLQKAIQRLQRYRGGV